MQLASRGEFPVSLFPRRAHDLLGLLANCCWAGAGRRRLQGYDPSHGRPRHGKV